MKRIIIAGYPKSGNTWLCRMIAEALDAPYAGFFDHGEIYPDEGAEGKQRKNLNLAIYKSHHTFRELLSLVDADYDRIVMIHRNPFDIAASGIAYFGAGINHHWFKYGNVQGKLRNRIHRMLSRVFPKFHHRTTIIYSICHGSTIKNDWLKHSWISFNQDLVGNTDVAQTSYEKLKTNPFHELSSILLAIKIEFNEEALQNAVRNQSIHVRRALMSHHLIGPEKIIRNGEIGASIKELHHIERVWIRCAIAPLRKNLEW